MKLGLYNQYRDFKKQHRDIKKKAESIIERKKELEKLVRAEKKKKDTDPQRIETLKVKIEKRNETLEDYKNEWDVLSAKIIRRAENTEVSMRKNRIYAKNVERGIEKSKEIFEKQLSAEEERLERFTTNVESLREFKTKLLELLEQPEG